MNKKFVLGLTGPTGSGKSKLARIFEQKGYVCLNADEIYHNTIKSDTLCYEKLIKQFGKKILFEDGQINTKEIAAIVFKDKEQLKILERITHPFVFCDIKQQIQYYINQGKPIVLDAPTLFESGCDMLCDKTVAIIAQKQVRLDRILKRDLITKEQAIMRLENQKSDEYYRSKADYAIVNDTTLDELSKQVHALYNHLNKEE